MPLLFLHLLFLSTFLSPSLATQTAAPPESALQAFCYRARYRRLCVKTFTSNTHKPITVAELVNASMTEALDKSQKASAYISLVAHNHSPHLNFSQERSLDRCRRLMNENVEPLIVEALTLLLHMQPQNSTEVMFSVYWGSITALAHVDTCLAKFHLKIAETRVILRRVRQVYRILANVRDILFQALLLTADP